jgi:predicted hotdog family 3-hydroxylacyl-ACP dehydratase
MALIRMLPKTDWAHLIPHAGSMCLLDAVQSWDEQTIHAISSGHLLPDNPLRGNGGLHAINLAEYGAQAMAVHGGLLARMRGNATVRPGRLVSLREVQLSEAYVDQLNGRLDVHAQCLYADDNGAQYSFRIEHDGRVICSGRAAVIHPAEG